MDTCICVRRNLHVSFSTFFLDPFYLLLLEEKYFCPTLRVRVDDETSFFSSSSAGFWGSRKKMINLRKIDYTLTCWVLVSFFQLTVISLFKLYQSRLLLFFSFVFVRYFEPFFSELGEIPRSKIKWDSARERAKSVCIFVHQRRGKILSILDIYFFLSSPPHRLFPSLPNTLFAKASRNSNTRFFFVFRWNSKNICTTSSMPNFSINVFTRVGKLVRSKTFRLREYSEF